MLEKYRIQEIQIKSGHLKSIYKDEKLFNSVQRCFKNPSLILKLDWIMCKEQQAPSNSGYASD